MTSLTTGPAASPPCLPLSCTSTATTISGLRRGAHEPGIVFKFFLFPEAFAGCITDNLRGARFSTDFNSRKPDVPRRATLFVDNAVHGIRYFLDRRFRKCNVFLTNAGRVLQQMRLLENAAHGDAANHTRQ